MRTTLDIPGELLTQAKIAAVQRRSTLRDLVAGALRRELSHADRPLAVTLPQLHLPADAPVLRLSPAALKAAIAEDEEADDARL